MLPLLDLDDDVIAATLGFADPRSLCSATMVSRRLRRLADAAWVELDKNLEPNQREGGNTPRERVLSSFIVHSDKERIRRVIVGDFRRIQAINFAELASRDHLLYVQIYDMTSGHLYYDSFIGASGALMRTLGTSQNGDSVDLPMQREHAKDGLDAAVTCFSVYRVCCPPLQQFAQRRFQSCIITIAAFERRTLSPRILLYAPRERVPSVQGVRLSDGSNRVEVSNNWAQVLVHRNEFNSPAAAPVTRTEVGFYFQNESFGLMINRHQF